MKIPAVFRSRKYIMALTGSLMGILAARFADVQVVIMIVGMWAALVTGTTVRDNIDAYKGQYFDK